MEQTKKFKLKSVTYIRKFTHSESEMLLLILASESKLPLVCMLDSFKVIALAKNDGSFKRLNRPFHFIYGFLSHFIESRT